MTMQQGNVMASADTDINAIKKWITNDTLKNILINLRLAGDKPLNGLSGKALDVSLDDLVTEYVGAVNTKDYTGLINGMAEMGLIPGTYSKPQSGGYIFSVFNSVHESYDKMQTMIYGKRQALETEHFRAMKAILSSVSTEDVKLAALGQLYDAFYNFGGAAVDKYNAKETTVADKQAIAAVAEKGFSLIFATIQGRLSLSKEDLATKLSEFAQYCNNANLGDLHTLALLELDKLAKNFDAIQPQPPVQQTKAQATTAAVSTAPSATPKQAQEQTPPKGQIQAQPSAQAQIQAPQQAVTPTAVQMQRAADIDSLRQIIINLQATDGKRLKKLRFSSIEGSLHKLEKAYTDVRAGEKMLKDGVDSKDRNKVVRATDAKCADLMHMMVDMGLITDKHSRAYSGVESANIFSAFSSAHEFYARRMDWPSVDKKRDLEIEHFSAIKAILGSGHTKANKLVFLKGLHEAFIGFVKAVTDDKTEGINKAEVAEMGFRLIFATAQDRLSLSTEAFATNFKTRSDKFAQYCDSKNLKNLKASVFDALAENFKVVEYTQKDLENFVELTNYYKNRVDAYCSGVNEEGVQNFFKGISITDIEEMIKLRSFFSKDNPELKELISAYRGLLPPGEFSVAELTLLDAKTKVESFDKGKGKKATPTFDEMLKEALRTEPEVRQREGQKSDLMAAMATTAMAGGTVGLAVGSVPGAVVGSLLGGIGGAVGHLIKKFFERQDAESHKHHHHHHHHHRNHYEAVKVSISQSKAGIFPPPEKSTEKPVTQEEGQKKEEVEREKGVSSTSTSTQNLEH